MAATAVWALWTTAEHVGSMATTTADDILMVYGDAGVDVIETTALCSALPEPTGLGLY